MGTCDLFVVYLALFFKDWKFLTVLNKLGENGQRLKIQESIQENNVPQAKAVKI